MTREELNQEKQEEIFKEENAIKRRIFLLSFLKVYLFYLFS